MTPAERPKPRKSEQLRDETVAPPQSRQGEAQARSPQQGDATFWAWASPTGERPAD